MNDANVTRWTGRLPEKISPPKFRQIWSPEESDIMESHMRTETMYYIIELLGDPLAPEWEKTKKRIENANSERKCHFFPTKQPTWLLRCPRKGLKRKESHSHKKLVT